MISGEIAKKAIGIYRIGRFRITIGHERETISIAFWRKRFGSHVSFLLLQHVVCDRGHLEHIFVEVTLQCEFIIIYIMMNSIFRWFMLNKTKYDMSIESHRKKINNMKSMSHFLPTLQARPVHQQQYCPPKVSSFSATQIDWMHRVNLMRLKIDRYKKKKEREGRLNLPSPFSPPLPSPKATC